jgi:hypothetical protein
VGVTVLVAPAGWVPGMAPSALWLRRLDDGAADAAGATAGPPAWLMPAGGAALGLLLGALFGAAQAAVLRGHVTHPRRWVTANALGWAAAMAVIMTGASLPSGPWPPVELLALGAATGIVAGLATGGVTGIFLPHLGRRADHGVVEGH